MPTHDHGRHGAKQPSRFDPARAAVLDDRERFAYVPPERVLELLDPPAGGTVLDFGAGTGTYAIELAARRPDARVIALDEQDAMLAKLSAKPEAAAQRGLTVARPRDLPALAGTVDRILALNVLHELGDDALTSLRTLLAPGGWAVVIDWNGDVERPVGPPNDHVYGAADAAVRLEAAGFDVRPQPELPYHHVFVARLPG